jgi:hypothetical protein
LIITVIIYRRWWWGVVTRLYWHIFHHPFRHINPLFAVVRIVVVTVMMAMVVTMSVIIIIMPIRVSQHRIK